MDVVGGKSLHRTLKVEVDTYALFPVRCTHACGAAWTRKRVPPHTDRKKSSQAAQVAPKELFVPPPDVRTHHTLLSGGRAATTMSSREHRLSRSQLLPPVVSQCAAPSRSDVRI